MELIKLLDVANPKVIKDTLNKVSQDYETFRTEIEEAANTALNTAVTANDTANTALTTVTDYEAIVMESAQDSSSARLVAEEALAMITQADERSQEAALLAEQSFTEASEAVQTSELAMNVANEAKSTVDQALDIGSLGSFVHNVNGIALAHAHMTDDPNQADDEELSFLATPTLVREAIKGKADLTNTEQTITAGELKIDDGNIWGSDNGLSIYTPKSLSLNSDNELTRHSDEFVYIDSETYINGVLRAKKNLSVSGDTTITGNLSVSGTIENEGLTNAINDAKPKMEKIAGYLGYEQGNKNLYEGKKFSDYLYIVFVFKNTHSEEWVTEEYPRAVFTSTTDRQFVCSRYSGEYHRYIEFRYIDDTTLYIGNNHYMEIMEVWGLR